MRLAGLVCPLLLAVLATRAGAQVPSVQSDHVVRRRPTVPFIVAQKVDFPLPPPAGSEIPQPLTRERRMRLTGGIDGSLYADLTILHPSENVKAHMELLRPTEVYSWSTLSSHKPRATFAAGTSAGLRLIAGWNGNPNNGDGNNVLLVACRLWMGESARMRVASAGDAVREFSPSELVDGNLVFIIVQPPAPPASGVFTRTIVTSTEPWTLFGCELRHLRLDT